MTRKVLFVASAVLLFSAVMAQAAVVVPPTIGLPLTYTGFRMMEGAVTSAPATSAVNVEQKGNVAGSYSLSVTPSLALLSGASGAVPKNSVKGLPFTFKWTDRATLGVHNGVVTLGGSGVTLDNTQMAVSGDVLENRPLTITGIGTGTAVSGAVRIMARAPLTTTLAAGTESDDIATRVATVAKGAATNGSAAGGARVTYVSTPVGDGVFNAPGDSATLGVSFSTVGHYASDIDVAPKLLKDGEAKSVGATVAAADLDYNVLVLEQRKLKAETANVGVLLNAPSVAGNFTVDTTNGNANYATNVQLNGTAGDFVVSGANIIGGATTSSVPFTGTPDTSYYGTQSPVGAKLQVTTLDAAAGDTKPYADLSVRYSLNVGIAQAGAGTFGPSLSALVPAGGSFGGGTATGLASKVNPKNALVSNNTTLARITAGKASLSDSALYGIVGSEAQIVYGTSTSASATNVTMAWRARTPAEAGVPGAVHDPLQPSGINEFTSDVVNISGAGLGDYALQMTFDDRISLMKDSRTGGLVANNWQYLYVGKLGAGTGGSWGNAGDPDLVTNTNNDVANPGGHLESLADFMTHNQGTSLASLVGNWGVDPSVDQYGIGHSWVITAGGGTFAVVPEPSTFVLLLIGAFGFVGYRLRRRWL